MATVLHRACRSIARGAGTELDFRDPVLAPVAADVANAPAILAFEALRRGDPVEARRHYAELPPGFRSSSPGPSMRFLAEVAAHLGDPGRLSWLYDLFLPYKDRMLSWGRVSIASEGPATWLLGAMCGGMARYDEARDYFEDALRRSEQSGNRPYLALTALDYALMLHRAGLEPARVAELSGLGRNLGSELGMHEMVTRYEAWLAPSAAVGVPAAVQATPNPPASPAATTHSLRLYRDGEVWAVETGDRTVRLKDARGIQILSLLVESPHREFHVLTLVNSALGDASDASDALDDKAVTAYREHVHDLEAELAEAEEFGDLGRAERLRHDLELVRQELARGLGLGGRKRRTSGAAERARVNVQRRIRDAIRRIAQEDPAAGRHLDRSVRTGTFCAYEPDERA
jgi:hypothetical protein